MKKNLKSVVFLLLWVGILLTTACRHKPQAVAVSESDKIEIAYAKGFEIREFNNYTEVSMRNPWDTTKLLHRYILIAREQPVPENLPDGEVIRIPLERMIVYTTVHASIIDELGVSDRIVGVCEPEYIDNEHVKERIESGAIANLGKATNPDIEKIIDLEAEVILASPFENSSYGVVEKMGIPILECGDYLEHLPLGRAEWIKLYGILFGAQAKADSIFKATEKNYLTLKKQIEKLDYKPTLMVEKKYGSAWYVPTGESYMGAIFRDAGANYLFDDLKGAGSKPLTFETVLDRAIGADIWLIKYNMDVDLTYQLLEEEYDPYRNFKPFKERQIWGCNTGVIHYYEILPMHPDLLLRDLAIIFHPELFSSKEKTNFYSLIQ